MPTIIRHASLDDAELLSHLIRGAFLDVAERFGFNNENCPTHPAYCEKEWVTGDFEKGIAYFVGEQDREPCGCIALGQIADACWHIRRLAVLPQFRRHGIGGLLLDHTLEEIRRRGGGGVSLEILAKHEELRCWYEQRGFEAAELCTFPHLPFEVLFMRLSLP